MTLTINDLESITIADSLGYVETLLQEICSKARVDRKTGKVSLAGADGKYKKGCDCLAKIIDSDRAVVIHLLPGPDAKVPGANGSSIAGFGGGATRGDDAETDIHDGKPGVNKKDKKPGGDCQVYIDVSNNDHKGYSAPAWLILGHELTGGHASLCVQGLSAATVAAR